MFTIIETDGRFYLWYNGLDDIARLAGDFDSEDEAKCAESSCFSVIFEDDFV